MANKGRDRGNQRRRRRRRRRGGVKKGFWKGFRYF
jgi:hypothetical protein